MTKKMLSGWALPCKLCCALSHDKGFAVLILAFIVHLPRTATCCSLVVQHVILGHALGSAG
jgi:hypothetical protein